MTLTPVLLAILGIALALLSAWQLITGYAEMSRRDFDRLMPPGEAELKIVQRLKLKYLLLVLGMYLLLIGVFWSSHANTPQELGYDWEMLALFLVVITMGAPVVYYGIFDANSCSSPHGCGRPHAMRSTRKKRQGTFWEEEQWICKFCAQTEWKQSGGGGGG